LALEKAKNRLDEATKVREALEAEAQEVAQLAVEANDNKDKAKNKVFMAVSEIEDITRQQNEYLERVEKLQEKLDAARASRSSSSYKPQEVISMEVELEAAQNLVDELTDNLDSLRDTVKVLFENAVAAEASALRAEEIAAADMKAAEGAVKDEMEAAAVVRETQAALEKTIYGLEALKPGSVAPAAAVAAEKSADATSSTDEAAAPAEVKAAEPVEDEVKVPRWLALTAGVAFAAILFSWTPAGQGVMASLQPMIDSSIGSIHIDHSLHGLIEAICLMFAAVVCVPAVVKIIPGGNPVLGYLLAGALVGPYAFGIIHDVEHMRHTAELGVVFLLFNIGLELSIERLQAMAKFVFGMGTCQVLLSLAGVGAFAMALAGLTAPAAIVLGGALAMSSTAVVIQVLEERGEMGSRFGRATFSVLLLQDLAVVVLLMLIPLLAPSDSGGGLGAIMAALGTAAVKAILCIVGIIALGRKVVTPLYNWMADFANAEIFAATTLVITLGTAVLTQVAGLSLALGAFLAGLLISETDYALQVESDIAPYKGLLMGLFFMTVGMEISVSLFCEKWKTILVSIFLLLAGKVAVMMAAGAAFGLPKMAALRAGLLLAPGGEFAFVAFGEAVSKGLLPVAFSKELYLTVALSMAMIPYLAAAGGMLGQMFDKSDVKSLQPQEGDNHELSGHVIIAGYGRIGQTLGQMLSQELIPFCALDASSDVVQKGRAQDLPVYFGDAGSMKVLHHMGAERAACIVIVLDTPGANYRAVWTIRKHFPHLKIYVRAFDVAHGKNLEAAGATAVVPETLEPSLQLASAVFSELDYPKDEVASVVDRYRRAHIAELTELSMMHNTTLGYGYDKKSSGKDGVDPNRDMKTEVERALHPAPA